MSRPPAPPQTLGTPQLAAAVIKTHGMASLICPMWRGAVADPVVSEYGWRMRPIQFVDFYAKKVIGATA